jgi:hypothetical protein
VAEPGTVRVQRTRSLDGGRQRWRGGRQQVSSAGGAGSVEQKQGEAWAHAKRGGEGGLSLRQLIDGGGGGGGFGSAVLRRQGWPPVVPNDRRRTLQVGGIDRGDRGLWIWRGGARRAAHRGKRGERGHRPNPDG